MLLTAPNTAAKLGMKKKKPRTQHWQQTNPSTT